MKRFIRLIIISLFVFPMILFADTYEKEVKNANNLIKKEFYINTYEKYILQKNKLNYEYNNDKFKFNKKFITGGFISKDEYELTKVRNLSYLLTSKGYWTLSTDGDNVYAITKDDIEEAKDPNSDYGARVTEYVNPNVVVSGSGTSYDPWQFDPMFKVTAVVEDGYAVIESGNNQYVKGNCSTDGCLANIKIKGNSGYKYITNDCGATYNNKTKTLVVKNVGRNLICNVEFGYGLFTINLSDARPEIFYAVYDDNFYSDMNTKAKLNKIEAVKQITGYTFDGYTFDDIKLVDKDLNLNRKALTEITEDLAIKPTYKQNQYKLKFNCNGGKNGPVDQVATYDSEFTMTKELCQREGFIQVGWNSQFDGQGYAWSEKNRTDWVWNFDNDVTIYAVWKKCEAGTYSDLSSNVCTKCEAGTYSGDGASKCISCPDGYTSNEGTDLINKCYITVKPGKYLKDAKSTNIVECRNGEYNEEHTVKYGDKSVCFKCPSGYLDGDKLEDKISQKTCKRNVTAGNYIATSGSPGNTVCPNGYYKESHVVRFGETSSCTICPDGYRDGSKLENKLAENTCLRSIAAGYYIASSKSINNTVCPNGEYSIVHTIKYGETSKCTACPTGYQDGTELPNKIAKTACLKKVPAGNYVASNQAQDTKVCANGFYRESHTITYGNVSKCYACPEGYRDGTKLSDKVAKSSCLKSVSGGYYVANPADKSVSSCANGYYKEKHGVTYGNVSSCNECPTGYRDGRSTTSKSSISSCTMIVEAGNYLPSKYSITTSVCSNGTYKGTHNVTYGSTSSCNSCPDGYRDGKTLESKTAENKCVRNVPAGYYIRGTKATNETICPTGYYKENHTVEYGSISRCVECPSGYRNGTKLENKVSLNSCIKEVSKNYYIARPNDENATSCPTGKKREAHTVLYGNTSSCY